MLQGLGIGADFEWTWVLTRWNPCAAQGLRGNGLGCGRLERGGLYHEGRTPEKAESELHRTGPNSGGSSVGGRNIFTMHPLA
jgi:hypothetical protein